MTIFCSLLLWLRILHSFMLDSMVRKFILVIPIHTTSPCFCFFLEKIFHLFSVNRYLSYFQKISALTMLEVFSNVSIFSNLTADNGSVESVGRSKIKHVSVIIQDFYVKLTKTAGSHSILSSCLAANSAETSLCLKDGVKSVSYTHLTLPTNREV